MDAVSVTTGLGVRFGWAALAAAAGWGMWHAAGGGVLAAGVSAAVLPDVALVYGIAPGLARGQLAPRAVPLYNALHAPWGPLAFLATGVALGSGLVVAVGLGWALHLAVDRAVGYGPRTADGFRAG